MNVEELRTAREREVRPDAPGANLTGADLFGADLRKANLFGADLRGAILSDADLRKANLFGADLRKANLTDASTFRRLGGTPSGLVHLYPTPNGWMLRIGCWQGTPDELRAIATDFDREWPSGCDREEKEERSKALLTVLATANEVMAANAGIIRVLAQTWGTS